MEIKMKSLISKFLIAALLIPSLSWGAGVNLQTQVQGVLPILNGGTGNTTATVTTATNLAGGLAGAVVFQSSSGHTDFVTIGATGTVLTGQGTSPPSFSATPPLSTSGLVAYSANATFSSSDFGHLIVISGSGTGYTLPIASGHNGQIICIFNNGAFFNLNVNTGSVIVGAGGFSSYIGINSGDSIILSTDGTNWFVVSNLPGVGYNQTWASVTRTTGTTYTNTTSKPIVNSLQGGVNCSCSITVGGVVVQALNIGSGYTGSLSVVIPPGKTYVDTYNVASTIDELR
jgi:hypothetical protein